MSVPAAEREAMVMRGELPGGVTYQDVVLAEAPGTAEVGDNEFLDQSEREAAEAVARHDAMYGGSKDYRGELEDNLAIRDERLEAMEREKEMARRLTSRPWTERRSVNRLMCPKRPGWARRWVLKRRVEGLMTRGWQVASMNTYKFKRDPRIAALVGQGQTDAFERNALILMEIPEVLNERNQQEAGRRAALQSPSAVDKAVALGAYKKEGHFGGTRKQAEKRRIRTGPVGSWT